MRLKWLGLAVASVAAFGMIAGCGASDEEPSEAQKQLVPEAKNGAPVTKDGEQFTRQSDRN